MNSPPELPIWPHNEYGWSTINPAWIMFSALKTPDSGIPHQYPRYINAESNCI